MRGQPTPNLGLLQESCQGWVPAQGLTLLPPSSWGRRWDPWNCPSGREVVSYENSQENTWHFCLPWAQTCNSSLVCLIVCAFSSKGFTTPSPFWAKMLDAAPRISSELEREGGWETSLWAVDSVKGQGRHWSHLCPARERQVWLLGVCAMGREARRKT